MAKVKRSEALFARANAVIPGGVNSPVRAFASVGGNPPFISRGQGAHIWDVDGNRYLDYVMSWGPLILSHAHPEILAAIHKAAESGTTFGASTEREVVLAETISRAIPSMQKVRLVSSGTEATMSAVRVARAATKRQLIVKFSGCYHGHADSFLVQAGSGAATLGVPNSPGVPDAIAQTTLVARYNDLASVEALFKKHSADIAAIIVEPIAGNMGLVLPVEGFLSGLRTITSAHGSLLIFDEVISGFRATYGGYQKVCGVTPDLTCLGKIIGGGLPLAAFGGRKELMDLLAPVGGVYQAGTLSGNPLAVAAGLKTLEVLEHRGTYEQLEERGTQLAAGLAEVVATRGIEAHVAHSGSLLTLFFRKDKIHTWDDAAQCDTAAFGRFHRAMLAKGVFLPPSQFEAWFISLAHAEVDVQGTINAAAQALQA